MSILVLNSKNIADLLSQVALYIPKGLILPVVQFIDESRQLLKHHHVACAFCQRNLPPPEGAKSTITNRINDSLSAVEQLNVHIIMWCFKFINLLISTLFPELWIKFVSSKIEKSADKFSYSANALSEWLIKNRNKIVWYGLIPLVLLTAISMIWGVSLIPEIYIFFIASFWGGKILNHLANLIVHQKNSEEWAFLKKCWEKIKNPNQEIQILTEKQAIKPLAIRIAIELTLVNIIGKFSQFISYCFQAFFSWLIFYILVKTASEQAPQMLHSLEKSMNQKNKQSYQYGGIHFDNLLWLVSYQAFRSTGSEKAQASYDELHEKIHHIPSRPTNV